jgi:hypothetical protein
MVRGGPLLYRENMHEALEPQGLPDPPENGSPSRSPRSRLPDVGPALLPGGVFLTLLGLLGDLLSHALAPEGHAAEPLVSFGSGGNPWHLVLFTGIFLTAVGGIRWAARVKSDWGGVLGAAMALMLVGVVAVGGWVAWQERSHGTAIVADGHGGGAAADAAHDDGTGGGAVGGAPDSVGGVGAHRDHAAGAQHSESAEGASVFGHGHAKPGKVTPAQRNILDRQLATAKRATARFRDIEVARAGGYFQVTQFIPGLGLHLVNLGIGNTSFDPARPQILLYEPNEARELELVGVSYQIKHVDETPPQGFAGGSDVWHYHENLCFQKGGTVTIAGSEEDCMAANGLVFQEQTAWLLHAWVWKANPEGVFTEYNPAVA